MWDIWLHALDLAVPKNNTDEAIVAASSRVSQFRQDLLIAVSRGTRRHTAIDLHRVSGRSG